MAVLDDLLAAKANIAANLKAMTGPTAKPTYTLDGESYSWGELFQLYTEQSLKLDEWIAREGGPYEFRQQAVT